MNQGAHKQLHYCECQKQLVLFSSERKAKRPSQLLDILSPVLDGLL